MFLLVSGRHVGAHLGGHQHGGSIQISLNLEKTFLLISSVRKIAVTWILARVFAYLPSFYFQILDLIDWTVFIFYFDLFWMAWHWKPAIDVSFLCICPVVDNKFLRNVVNEVDCKFKTTASLTLLRRNSWSITLRTEAWKADVNLSVNCTTSHNNSWKDIKPTLSNKWVLDRIVECSCSLQSRLKANLQLQLSRMFIIRSVNILWLCFCSSIFL